MTINAHGLKFDELNSRVKKATDREVTIDDVLGQRYIGSGVKDKIINVYGTPGNALGAYMTNSHISVFGNAQDALGDTMNGGSIVVHGNAGDTVGYAMRGGDIYIKGNAGFRVGIHMKSYQEHVPHIVIGGSVGDFLGEYQAGGVIIVLGIGCDGDPIGKFCATGQHGGAIYVRGDSDLRFKSDSVRVESNCDITDITRFINEYCRLFNQNAAELLSSRFCRITPVDKNPYNRMYKNV